MATLISSLLTYDEDRLTVASLLKAVNAELDGTAIKVRAFAFVGLSFDDMKYVERSAIRFAKTDDEAVTLIETVTPRGEALIIVEYLDIEGYKAYKHFIAK
ncbi:hypothetical protein D7009_17345 [Escherichia coli]|nr:hypothetical protein [Escherichia coli]EEW3692994.1 hypothetical protein [Escherichia coli]EEW5863301.1 hypothetical protein [Escherichia coli]EEW5904463.1 hypothetical protein [Escherichia coli]EFG8139412.1 hypothetical protein [Escherichia coli]